MGKPTICIGENKDADQLREATRIVQFLFYLNPKFQASSSFLFVYRPVCVGPGRNPNCWFSHAQAQLQYDNQWSKILTLLFGYWLHACFVKDSVHFGINSIAGQ